MSGNPSSVTFEVERPQRYNRLTVLLRMCIIIPHTVVLMFLGSAQVVVTLLAWAVILLSGRYPEGLYNFSLSVSRWCVRLLAYVNLLTDEYPPLAPEELAGERAQEEPSQSVTVSRTA